MAASQDPRGLPIDSTCSEADILSVAEELVHAFPFDIACGDTRIRRVRSFAGRIRSAPDTTRSVGKLPVGWSPRSV